MTTISVTPVLRSRNAAAPKHVVSTFLMRYPRWIHAEGRTHRLLEILEDMAIAFYTPALMDCDDLSRNASSSRALPVEKLIQDVLNDTATPMYWGGNQKGMQAGAECNEPVLIHHNDGSGVYDSWTREQAWAKARDQAIVWARAFAEAGYHKQIVNRLLEPFSHITVVVTATEWDNFLELRDHADAEPHIALLARQLRVELEREDNIQTLKPGEWHLPFVGIADDLGGWTPTLTWAEKIETAIKLSVARCASTSYKTVDGFDMTLDRAIALHDKLVGSKPLHASPCEHVCQADGFDKHGGYLTPWWENRHEHANFVGFRQYRKQLEKRLSE